MAVDILVERYGILGLILAVVGHMAYQYYRDNYGAIERLRAEMHSIHTRLDGMAIIQYRQAQELDGINEVDVRDRLFNGNEVTFPADFDEEGYTPQEGD